MVYAVTASIVFSNASKAETIATALNSDVGPLQRWGATTIASLTGALEPNPRVRVLVRFETEADRDDFYDAAIARLKGPRTPEPGSTIAKHNCTHDESVPVGCVDFDEVVY